VIDVPLHEGPNYSHLWRAPEPEPRRRRRGGRPRRPIPALVVAYAAALHSRVRTWTAVLAELERSGNGRWARNTLRRRVEELRAERSARR